MSKQLKITLLLTVKPLTEDEIFEANRDSGYIDDDGEPVEGSEDYIIDAETSMDEADADELADIVKTLFNSEAVTEAFAGSNMYVTFDSHVEVESVELE